MFKNFFYFTKGQRVGIIVLIVLILIVIAANYILPILLPTEDLSNRPFIDEVNQFKITLVSRDSLRTADWKRKYEDRQREYEEKYKNKQYQEYKKGNEKYVLFSFDPNKADSIELCRLGIKSFVVSNIVKYRKKGGLFRTKLDFSKVYGMLPDKFKELESFIVIHPLYNVKVDSLKVNSKIVKQNIIVELNSADTILLMQVKGIGRGYAKGIVRLRRETGGFVSVEQLREVFGMNAGNFERIRPSCTVNIDLVQKINVNTATVERLNAHSYLNFYQAKAIFELRRKKGKLKGMSDLLGLSEFKPEELTKIQPYLNFD